MRFLNLLNVCAILLLSVSLANGQVIVQHYWNFEGDYDDQVGMAHGSVTASTTVAFDTGFDGGMAMRTQASVMSEDDFVRIDNTQTFVPGSQPFSISYWFNMTFDGTADPRGIFDFSGDGGDGAQSLFIGNTNQLAFRVDGSNPASTTPALFSMNLEDSQWHFAVGTYDPATGVELHVDGPGVDGSGPADGDVTFDADQYLGTFNFNATMQNKGLNGRLDDLAIYSGILTNDDIQGLFEGTLSPLDFSGSGCDFDLGDVNQDGAVDFLDIQPFVDLLNMPGSFQCEADVNEDGVVDFLDIEPFVDLLS